MNSMTSEDCKRMIVDIMGAVVKKLKPEDINSLAGLAGDVTNPNAWKRTYKNGKAEVVIKRGFKNTSQVGWVIEIAETLKPDGNIEVNMDFTGCPQYVQDALDGLDRAGSFNVTEVRKKDKGPSIMEGPKPECFGAFS